MIQFLRIYVYSFFIAVVLWCGCFTTWIEMLTRGRINPDIWTDCKLYYFLFDFGRQYSSTLLVLMSIEKCFAVYFPLKAKTVCTVRTAKWSTGIAGVVLAAFNVINFFLESRFIKSSNHYVCYYSFDPSVVSVVYNVQSALYSFGPFALMFITNFALAFRFMRAKCDQSNSSQSTNQALAKSATRGTAMVVTVSITFLLLTTPTAMNMVLWHNIQLSNNKMYRAFMNLTQYLNHSINGVLYIIVGTRFRNELLKLFCRKKKPDVMPLSHSANNTGLSTISRG